MLISQELTRDGVYDCKFDLKRTAIQIPECKFQIGDIVRTKCDDLAMKVVGFYLAHDNSVYFIVEWETGLRVGFNANELLKSDKPYVRLKIADEENENRFFLWYFRHHSANNEWQQRRRVDVCANAELAGVVVAQHICLSGETRLANDDAAAARLGRGRSV